MKKINKICPYFIEKVDNNEELVNTQKKLFKNSYQWLDGTKISISFVNFMERGYPLYISNLPFKNKNDEKTTFIKRKAYNQFNNNIIFVDEYKDSFDLIFLRCEKMKVINSIQI